MNTSVLIACYNAGRTIEAAIESVLAQTRPAGEIIVLLDGPTDDTEVRLERFAGAVRLLKQPNRGVACARNQLVHEAKGEILAFLDADDIWHPKYLKAQTDALEKYPEAVGAFTGHITFRGDNPLRADATQDGSTQLFDPATFLMRYHTDNGLFASMSFLCVRKSAVSRLGPEPFSNDLHGVEDLYLCSQFALQGPIVFNSTPLVAYRFTEGSLTENQIRTQNRCVMALERLEGLYAKSNSEKLRAVFREFYASKRRVYGKILMGTDHTAEARRQLMESLRNCRSPVSMAKSLALLAVSALPRSLQPHWPSPTRQLSA